MIETCLFDMGNVLVHFSHPRMCAQLAAVCGCDAEEMRRLMFDEGWEIELERGEVSERQFHARLENHFQRNLDFEQVVRASSDIFSLNEPMVPLLRALRQQNKRLVLLSNTSVSHIDFVKQEYDILDCFDDFVLSFEVGAMKPEAAIFEAALEKIRCSAEHCFYTDDIVPYVEQGRKYGLQAEVFTTAASLQQQLAARGVLLP